jgi:hypothetical protein
MDYLTVTALRERGWTPAMIRDLLGEPDDWRDNPIYRNAAPVRLYAADRVTAAESSPAWGERRERAARRSAAGKAVADRKREETHALAREIAGRLVSGLSIPPDVQQRAIADYNALHDRGGDYDKYASCDDSPEFLARITVNYVRHMLTDYDDAYGELARKVGHQEAHATLRDAVNAAITGLLNASKAA